MLNAFRLRVSSPGWLYCNSRCTAAVESSGHQLNLRVLPSNRRHSASFNAQSVDSASSQPLLFPAIESSASIQPSQLNFTHRHIQFLSFMACAVAISATWLFCSAIPTLLAFKRAAESMEKLMDTTREELPSTMAAVRLSGMEISDLTMELSDLGQEITQGVRSSTRAVRVAEERLRLLTTANPIAVQEVGQTESRIAGPVLARTARGIREGIVKGRAALQIFFALTRYSKLLFSFFISRAKS